MGKDQTRRVNLRKADGLESDRDQALHLPGSTKMQSPEEARGLNDGKDDY